MAKIIGASFFLTFVYLLAGFAAPFIFKSFSNNQTAGHYAGTLFFLAGFWSIYLSVIHHYPRAVVTFFVLVLLLQIYFWGWRFFNSTPLKDAVLAGLSGPIWHQGLTVLYFLVAFTIFVYEMVIRVKAA